MEITITQESCGNYKISMQGGKNPIEVISPYFSYLPDKIKYGNDMQIKIYPHYKINILSRKQGAKSPSGKYMVYKRRAESLGKRVYSSARYYALSSDGLKDDAILAMPFSR